MKKFGIASVIALAAIGSASADIITQWDFNQYATSGALNNPDPSIGSGTASSLNLTGATPTTGSTSVVSGTQSSDPFQPGTAWNSTGYAAQGQNNNNTGLQFNVSTLGYQSGISVSFDVRASATASRYIRLLYSTDGVTFGFAGLANDGVYEITGGGSTVWNNGISFDLSSIAGVENNANFAIRIVTTFGPTGAYVAVGTGSYGTGGTLRYDMVTVNGVIPAPGAIALLGVAGLVGRRRRN